MNATDPTPTTTMERQTQRIVVRVLAQFVIPAFAILGIGTTVALYVAWQESEQREHDLCVRAVEGRSDSRQAFAAVFDVFPDDIPEVAQAREAIDKVLPPRDIKDC